VTADQELFADRLPTYLTRFVGRSREIADVESLLDDCRLVTICGVGGAGKTRLAIEVARRWRSRAGLGQAYWVSLAAISQPEAVPQAVVAGLDLDRGSGRDSLAVVIEALGDHPAVVLLDNCEHVAEACHRVLAPVMGACPELIVLATSREPLRVPGERLFPIPPLGAVDSSVGDDQRSEAADLFIDRALATAPAYALTESNTAVIGRICERLDGLPLAIELAASWVRVLSVNDLLVEIENGMEVLTSGTATVTARHRSMHAVLDSSWEWLGNEERRVLAGLSVFAGGFTREAAHAVAGARLSSLASLVERSLIQRLPDATGGTRYQVHELVRSYALERLECEGAEVAESARSLHLDFFLALVERADTAWETPNWSAWLELVRVDQANIDTAMLFALARRDAERALRLAAGLYSYWIFTSIPAHYSKVLDRALALPIQSDTPRPRGPVPGHSMSQASLRSRWEICRWLGRDSPMISSSAKVWMIPS
jgi:non-specific serine/threonine protein kinase